MTHPLSLLDYNRSLIEASLDPLVAINLDGKVIDVNQATEQATGCSRNMLFGSDFSDYFTEADKARSYYQLVLSQGHVADYPLTLRHISGETVDVLYSASLFLDEKGNVAGVLAVARCLTLVKDLQEKLERTTRDVDLYTKMTHLLQSCKTVDESIPIISATMQQLFAAVSGRCFLLNSSDNLMEEVAVWGDESPANVSIIPDDCWALRRGHIHEIGIDQNSINPPCNYIQSKNKPYMCIPLMAQGAVLGVIHLIFEGTTVAPTHIRHARLIVEAASDSISLALATLRLRESLKSMSIHDPLTGIFNRRFMEEAFAREISRAARADKPMAVAMVDIDHFKDFNDHYGHDAGDLVLKAVAGLMMGFRKGSDLVCRYGGEEFLLVLPGLNAQLALNKLDKFRVDISQLKLHHGGQALPPINISVGLAIYPEHGETNMALIRSADEALYHAKENGRNRIEMAGV